MQRILRKGKSYVDLAIRIRGVKASTGLSVYVPFPVSRDEIEDVVSNAEGQFSYLSEIVRKSINPDGSRFSKFSISVYLPIAPRYPTPEW